MVTLPPMPGWLSDLLVGNTTALIMLCLGVMALVGMYKGRD